MPNARVVGLAGAGVGIVLAVIVVAVVAVRSLTAEPPPPPTAGPSKATLAGEEGMRAPGTKELAALGCSPALVVDMARVLGDASGILPGEPRYMVTCDVPAAVEPPTCEKASTVYFAAIGGNADDPVGIRVLRAGVTAPLCSRLFAPNGADLGPLPLRH